MKIVPTPHTEQHLLRLHPGDTLPDTLLKYLRERGVTGGWLRLTGVLADVELRAFSAEIEGPGGTKRINGAVQAVVLDGSVGVADGNVVVDLRVVLARETDSGLETLAGELVRARVLGLEGSMVILTDTVVPRGLDKRAGVSLLRDEAIVVTAAPAATRPVAAQAPTPPAPAAPVAHHAVPAPAPSTPAIAATAGPRPSTPAPAPSSPALPPARPPRVADDTDDDGPLPQAGDLAEHFAFGACEILKSDGDRLHVRMKDGRIREIALEMLKVSALPPDGPQKRFRLSRRG